MMCDNNKHIDREWTFWHFLQHRSVEIPIIQRDYAQGRLGKEYLRRSFLTNLKEALDGSLEAFDGNFPNKEKRLKLDFVYGSINKDNKLHPLDGQQRLTTLWLLHWYVALRAMKLNEETCAVFRKFSYETRITSREFCQSLCEPKHFEAFTGKNIATFIKNSTWFYSAWKQDPTIQSMLRMLEGTKINDKNNEDIIDGLEELFEGIGTKKFEEYWETLVSDHAPIVFYYQPLEDFGLSDDLYVKMNARGKQLTAFENFKADLIGYIRENAENDNKWKGLLDASNGIPIKMDTKWMDIFWSKRSSDNKVDEIYYAFLNRFFWNELFIAKDSDKYVIQPGKENDNPLYKLLDEDKEKDDKYTEYVDLTPYKYLNKKIPFELFENLQMVLDRYIEYIKDERDTGEIYCPEWVKEKESFSFIPLYEDSKNTSSGSQKVKPITQIQRILFFAICKYFKEGEAKYFKEGEADEQSLTRWMRVVCNLVSGRDESGRYQIRDISLVRTAVEYIDKLDSHDVYKSLCDQEEEDNSDLGRRWTEEIYKARQILNEGGGLRIYDGKLQREKREGVYGTWEDIIIDAENYAFFNGGIRFLFYNEQGMPQWGDFDIKFAKARKHFKPDSLSNSTSCLEKNFDNAKLLKALISRFDSSQFAKDKKESFIDKAIFNNRPSTWRFYLMHHSIAEAVHQFLIEESPIIMPHNESENVEENIIYLLSNTDLLNFVIDYKADELNNDELKNTRIHCYYGDCWALYPPYKGGYMVCLNSTYRRDRFLAKNASTLVTVGNRVTDTNLFYGKDLPFDFAGKHFNWEINDYVYLMDDEDKGVYSFKNKEATNHDEKFYRFNAKGMDDDEIIAEMKKLIEEKIIKHNDVSDR